MTLVARKGLPLPGRGSFDYISANPSTNDEFIVVFTNSTPVALSAGDWFLSAVNISGGPATCRHQSHRIHQGHHHADKSEIPYFNANSGVGNATDYYRFVVSTNAVRTQFEMNCQRADMTLVALSDRRRPGLGIAHYISANPSTNDELIMSFTNSTPVALSAGDWYLSAVNISGGPATYAIKATEFAIITLTKRLSVLQHQFRHGQCDRLLPLRRQHQRLPGAV